MTPEPEERRIERIDRIPCAKACRHRIYRHPQSQEPYCGLWQKTSKNTSLLCPYDNGFPALCPLELALPKDAQNFTGLLEAYDELRTEYRRLQEQWERMVKERLP